jgi:glycosyltransferase involved in cell wall biosynthesis
MRIDPILFAGMIRLCRSSSPQIVHTHLFKSDFHGRLAARIAGVPVIVSTLHSLDRWVRFRPSGWIYGRTTRFADRLIAVSEEVRRFYADHTGTPDDKFVVIENGVDIQPFSGQESAGSALRQELGLDRSVPVLGIIGRLTPPKDHATFLKAASLIQRKAPQARFLVVGDGPLRGELETQARELGLSEVLAFIGLRKDIPAVLAALDVLVFSSLWEGLPVALLEGMAAAKPVVATCVGSIPNVVLPNQTALLVPPSDADAMAQACLTLIADNKMRRTMGQLGLERVRDHYSLETMVDRTASLYAKLLREKGLDQFIPLRVSDK